MKKFDCVLFDLDGTLFDTSQGVMECYKRGLEHFGIVVKNEEELRRVMGPALYVSYREFYGLNDEQVTEAIQVYREHYNREGIYRFRMYEGIDTVLSLLKQNNFTVCVATSKPQIMAEKILAHAKLASYFDVICGAELDGHRSDKVELIETALKQSGFTDKRRAVMIGDRFYDINGAHKAGISSIGVAYGFGGREELVQAGADYIVESAEDLLPILLT